MDLTVVAVPAYFGSMGAEYWWLRRHAEERGLTAADYEPRDTVASLAMGVGSLVAPFLLPPLLRRVAPADGRLPRMLLVTAVSAAAATTVADAVVRRDEAAGDDPGATFAPGGNRRRRRAARQVAAIGGVTTMASAVAATAAFWSARTDAARLGRRRRFDLGTGPAAVAAAVLGWDFIYYWNHRFSHQSRFLWAIHVVHHSSERYNLSTALRQPVADALGTFVPYGSLALLGIRPPVIETARGVNLLYQFWIHTDAIRRLGRFERLFNTPSHHRVHHGSNRQYLDRNHGSILIVWDRLFGTFEEESEPVVYGLTKNIDSFNLGRIATHEYADMVRDVAGSRSWRERFSYVVRGPGWAYERHAARDAAAAAAAPARRPTEPAAVG